MKPEDKKTLIMHAALELILEKGYNNTRIIDIADRAGIGKGTVYAYFESKEDIMFHLVRDIVRRDYYKFTEGFRGNRSLRENLVSYIEISVKMIEKYGVYAVIFRDEVMKDSNIKSEKVAALAEEMSEDQHKRIRGILEKAAENGEIDNANPDKTIAFVISVVTSHLLSRILLNNNRKSCPDSVREDLKILNTEDLADFILYGISGKKENNYV